MNDDPQLEALIHRELKQLPDRPAPQTLLHRVMLEVHQRARQPWWKRAWTQWPPLAQVLAVVVLLGCVATVSLLFGLAGDEMRGLSRNLGSASSSWSAFTGALGALSDAGGLLLKSGGQYVLIWGAVVLGSGYLTVVGLGSVCLRLAARRA